MNTVAKLALSLGAIGFALAGATAQAQTNVISDPVGFYKLPILPGQANTLSAPLHPIQTFRGTITNSTANTVSFGGSPNFAVNQFAPASGFSQFILIVRNDADKTNGAPNNVTGDWWEIVSNTANTITVNPGADNLATHLANGDQLEVRRLTSLQDLFGFGAACILNKDNDEDPNRSQEDIIRFVSGTPNGIGFDEEVYYHDGSSVAEGYYINGVLRPGTNITILPGQPFVLFRRVGSVATNITVLGQVQTTRLTQYLNPGGNFIANVFPAPMRLGEAGGGGPTGSGLKESGFIQDTDEDPVRGVDDIIRAVNDSASGVGFGEEIYLHSGASTTAGWYVNGVLNNNYSFLPGKANAFFIVGPGGRVWRQNVPFTP